MNRGEPVMVKDFRGRSLKRIVWEEFGRSIVVCTEDEYKNWELNSQEPKVVGFPFEDVEPVEKLVV